MSEKECAAVSSEMSADIYPLHIKDVHYQLPAESILLSFVADLDSGFINPSRSNSDFPTLRWILSKVGVDGRLVDPREIARDETYASFAFDTLSSAMHKAHQFVDGKFKDIYSGKEKKYCAIYVQNFGFDGGLRRDAFRVFPKYMEGEPEISIALRDLNERHLNETSRDFCHREGKRRQVEGAVFRGMSKPGLLLSSALC